MFRKLFKYFLSLTIVGGIIATIYYFYKNTSSDEPSEDFASEEMDTFHLDNDLEPITKRAYVPLNLKSESDEEKES